MKQITMLPRIRKFLEDNEDEYEHYLDTIKKNNDKLVGRLNELAQDLKLSATEYARLINVFNDQVLKYIPFDESELELVSMRRTDLWDSVYMTDQGMMAINKASTFVIVFTSLGSDSFVKVEIVLCAQSDSFVAWYYKLDENFPYTPVLTENGHKWKPEQIKRLIYQILFAL